MKLGKHRPSKGVPIIAEGDWGVDARSESVLEVRTGVRWMCGFIRSWAAWTDERVSGRVLLLSGILILTKVRLADCQLEGYVRKE